ncbi:MAG: hypothetical protein LBS56_07195 [Propionibacteriaceae bacterium]|nr:hypothetical protein [Propionibacteriaceae bacterium]
MFVLTDQSLQAGIDAISGFLVTRAAEIRGWTLEESAKRFHSSAAFAQLADPATGRYWDSLSELLEMFLAEGT